MRWATPDAVELHCCLCCPSAKLRCAHVCLCAGAKRALQLLYVVQCKRPVIWQQQWHLSLSRGYNMKLRQHADGLTP